ncbi:disease resistance protein SUMM2-like [Magnolia sinica]|uniref:disease resistance protein SUMM2-like n=1 Tax=Magnolia sinica TaxID=86752 RepID=UPI0026595554|nr:disease resistance protein SUMM2-like [Magnolia sinica]
MDFISPVIEIVSRLLDPITQRIRYAVKLRVNIDSVKNAMNELIRVRDDVKTKVDIAERQLLVGKSHVKRWLESVAAIEREVNGMEEAYQQMRRCLGNCRPNCWSGYKLSKRAAEKLTDVTELKRTGDSFDVVAEKPPLDVVEEQPSTSALGMDLMLEKVRGCLMEDSVGVVGIYGMGGVGKTTLLKKINNETAHGFNVVIWVVVSKEVNVAKIKKEIGERLGLIREEIRSNDEIRASDIHKSLSKMKFLLLLDDIWQRLDLEMIGIPHPSSQNKSKVVFTTRFEDVCGYMDADKKIKVECLARKEAWDLFREKVGEEAMNSHREILGLAELVAEECCGLPLALITIGRAMASKKTPEEWKYAITALRRAPSEISGMEDEVLFRLKFSYDSLRGDIIKSCFLYCSLFPEDYDISKEDLIDYWIGEGFLDEWDDDLDSARNKGHDLIGTLKAACLLESGYNEKTEVKMHDVIRDLALWISSECGKKKNKFLVKAGVGLREAPAIERWTEANRISLMENEIKEITETPNCPDLLTLMLQNNWSLSKMTSEFFQFMPHLRVLDLRCSDIEEIPAGIGNLVELRYLNLSYTQIKKLPEEIGCLTKLKHLDLNECYNLERIPRGVISRLSRLKVLKLLKDEYSSREVTEESGWFYLTEMEGLKWLSHLEITIETVHDLKSYLDSHKLPKLTQALTIGICEGLTTSTLLSSSFRAMRSIRRLQIVDCKEMEEMMIGWDVEKEDDHSVSSLESLMLCGLDNLNIIRAGGCIQNLCHINITLCPKLKSVTWILQLQNLEEIWIQGCEGVEEVIGTSDVRIPVREACLRFLKSLCLFNLPKLTSICNHALAFPSLEKLAVYKCPKLKKLPIGLQSANNPLKEIEGEQEWWDGLEWEEDGIKSNLFPLFKQIIR